MSKLRVLQPISEVLRAYWKSDRWMLLAVSLVVFLSSVGAIAAPYVFSRLIDILPQSDLPQALIWGFVLYAVLLGVSSALQNIVQYLSFMSAENLGFISNTRFFERILRKTSDFFVENNPAEIQNAASRGSSALVTLVELGLVVFIPGLTQIVLAFITLGALINFEVMAIVFAYGTLVITVTFFSARRARVHLERAIDAGQENARFVGNAMNAMETLRHFGSHDWMNERFSEKARDVRDNWRQYVFKRVGFVALLGFGLALQFAITFWLLLPRYEAGYLSLGNLVLFNTLILQLNVPFEMLAHAIDDVMRAHARLLPLATMWAAPEEREVENQSSFDLREGHIVFDNVSYTYDNGRGLSSVSFEAKRGSITFLIGETGSGKSTIFKLTLKSIEPQDGTIFADGTDLSTIDRFGWYSNVAVVPQETVLLNESLADNILLGRVRDEDRLVDVAEKSAVLPFIEALPHGFDTTVGERGLKLSGGERQRIAIARALYGDPSVLLLDEASSALDEATEREIMDHIRLLATEITVIAITHRRSVISDADKVIDLSAVSTTVAHQ